MMERSVGAMKTKTRGNDKNNQKNVAVSVCHFCSYLVVAVGVLTYSGCAFDSTTVQAKGGAPVAAQVPSFSIPHSEQFPMFALSVETVQFDPSVYEAKEVVAERRKYASADQGSSGRSASGANTLDGGVKGGVRDFSQGAPQMGAAQVSSKRTESTKTSSTTKRDYESNMDRVYERVVTVRELAPDRQAVKIAAQLTSALASVGNFVVIDPQGVKKDGGGRYSAALKEGQVGPFIVRALITEYSAGVERSNSQVGLPAIAGKKDETEQGVVTLDVTVLDGRSGQLVTSFPATGTFSSRDEKISAGVLVPLYQNRKFAQSLVEQALRVALNDAAKRAYEDLSRSSFTK